MKRLPCFFLYACLSMPFVACAHGPARVKVVESMAVLAPVEAVWAVISDFCSIQDWHPAITSCHASDGNQADSIRTISFANGETMQEKLFKHRPEDRMMQYALQPLKGEIVKSLPVATHGVTLRITAIEQGSRVEFKGAFYRAFPGQNPPPELSDEACEKAVRQLYVSGLENIKRLAEQ